MPAGYIEHGFVFTGSASGTVLSHVQGVFPTPAGILTGQSQSASKFDTQPVTEIQAALAGHLASAYGDDLYHRVHIIPASVDLGNLLSSQSKQVLVWNAHLSQTELTTINQSGADGITLVQPQVVPYFMQPLGISTYEVQVDIAGPPTINAAYEFTFNTGEQHTLPVYGKRVVMWSIVPQHGFIENLEWLTDVMRAKAGENRHALRKSPRQTFEYTYWLDDKQYALTKAIAYGWGERTYGVPVWAEAQFIGTVAAGATTVNVNTTESDYRIGEVILLWSNYDNYQAYEIDSINAGSVDLRIPTSASLEGVYAVPVRYGRAKDGIKAERDSNKRTVVDATFDVTANYDLGASVGFAQYNSIDVMTDVMYKVASFEEQTWRDVYVVDNQLGVPMFDAKYSTATFKSTVSWECTTRGQLWRLRKWLHSRKGKWKSFWLPTKLNELKVVDDVTPNANSITVEYAGYSLYYGSRSIMIELKSGIRYFNTVTSGSDNGDGTETLFLQTQFDGVTSFQASDVSFTCLMHKVRLDVDRIEIKHDLGVTTVTAPVIEVPV